MKDGASRVHSEIWDRALLEALFQQQMSDCVPMLIIRDLALVADNDGRAPLPTLAQRFRNFFAKRSQERKCRERPEVLTSVLQGSTSSSDDLESWRTLISDYASAELRDLVLVDEDVLAFRPDLWSRWPPGFRKALRDLAEMRLIEYFETLVKGGW